VLGAKSIVAIDVSNYEGAQVVHDMNLPIPEKLASSFDVVLDGGTLEHIFNIPTALKNAARMVRPNGRFLSLTMANNFCGHGFYQFSPELFYRFFCAANGYEMESCIMWESVVSSGFYRVPDPDEVGSRINLRSEFGAYLMVQARRLTDLPHEFLPQQSDYVKMWQQKTVQAAVARRRGIFEALRSSLRKIRALRSAVVSFKKLLGLQKKYSVADYTGSLLSETAREGVVTPLQGLRVIC
jgi:SAM-dependent methyltransferase